MTSMKIGVEACFCLSKKFWTRPPQNFDRSPLCLIMGHILGPIHIKSPFISCHNFFQIGFCKIYFLTFAVAPTNTPWALSKGETITYYKTPYLPLWRSQKYPKRPDFWQKAKKESRFTSWFLEAKVGSKTFLAHLIRPLWRVGVEYT